MKRLSYLVIYAVMFVASIAFQLARDTSISIRDTAEAAVTALILAIPTAFLARYLQKRRGQ